MASQAIGMAILVILFILFAIDFFTRWELDTTLSLAFLIVATNLVGIPFAEDGWQLLLRRRNGESQK